MADSCRVSPDVFTRRRLWADSGGYCGNPGHRGYLFADEAGVDFGELAHVIPASPSGPRGIVLQEMSPSERAHHTNLILLCANCHSAVDKAPSAYPVEMLHGWKELRVEELRTAVSIPVFTTRLEARRAIEALLSQNGLIHATYGPVGDPYRQGDPHLWQQHARKSIVPNNRRILRVLQANRTIMTQRERQLLPAFELHVEHFEARHVLGDFSTGTVRFPAALGHVFAEGEEAQA